MVSAGQFAKWDETYAALLLLLKLVLVNRVYVYHFYEKLLLSSVKCLMFLLEVLKPNIEAPILKESPKIEFDRDTLRLSLKSSFDMSFAIFDNKLLSYLLAYWLKSLSSISEHLIYFFWQIIFWYKTFKRCLWIYEMLIIIKCQFKRVFYNNFEIL